MSHSSQLSVVTEYSLENTLCFEFFRRESNVKSQKKKNISHANSESSIVQKKERKENGTARIKNRELWTMTARARVKSETNKILKMQFAFVSQVSELMSFYLIINQNIIFINFKIKHVKILSCYFVHLQGQSSFNLSLYNLCCYKMNII